MRKSIILKIIEPLEFWILKRIKTCGKLLKNVGSKTLKTKTYKKGSEWVFRKSLQKFFL